MPPDIPVWMPALGGVFAIIIVKQLYGGLGQNFMNPALAARCFLLISFTGKMTTFTLDGVSGATPLAVLKSGGSVDVAAMFLGRIPGTIGEVSVVALLIGAVYIAARSLGKYLGACGSCALTRCAPNITKYLGITLLPQAGVALGMALTAQQLSDGQMVRNVVLFSVLVYELVGPALTKRALIAAGEIQSEGRTSARRKNPPKAPLRRL